MDNPRASVGTTVLGDWYAKHICARPRVALCLSAVTCLPPVITGDKLRDHPAPRLRVGVEKSMCGMAC